ncbi:helix-turn-helix transcriptional regulator [Burkholderia ubonensis]|uniref:helix-turn-helix transcriptional regulator n=1 Tax=Burkholderia ubonensis TaxID=101571 RepID=UPI0008FDC22F|nr:LuxR family transcriptional regulator [Burkholderia ubonensis]OJA25016.1 LuxR family transcriptional regulator [Burkholderia ubonensis]
MKCDSAIASLIENFPTSASLKEADTGRYIVNNLHNSLQFGIKNPKDLLGLTIQDIRFNQPDWGAQYAKSIERLDLSTREKKSHVIGRHQFLDACGEAQVEEMVKFPVLGTRKNILGIVTYRHDITRTLPPINVYLLNRKFYNTASSIERTLTYFKVHQYFITPLTDAQVRVFLLRSERLSTKEISRFLRISDRTVECHCAALRNKVIDGNLPYVLSLMKESVSCDQDLTQS